ncbi:hypothetical protein [Planctomyces sp. SH-PL14]|uniref:hypothetical protein n=1 Tax=Planctomyces sp. SH-PL14 TaxID=1632864 RepID=UPI00078C6609|nr:hypothetical protein [Planctomyces sp. SH-PL14]AMV16610.1 hypothetical protein VT03_01890 [Planctomyces sp. SH-PL14]
MTIQQMQQFRGSSEDLSRRLVRAGIAFETIARDRIDFAEGVSQELQDLGNSILATWDWEAPFCPESVYMFQLRKAMRETLIVPGAPQYGDTLSALEAYIEAAEDADLADEFAAAEVRRDHQTVEGLALMFNWTDDNVDDLFRLAATK